MMRYRALLVDSEAQHERPVQIFGHDLTEIERWANGVLMTAVSQDATVLIYQNVEQQIRMVVRQKTEVSA